MILHFPAEVGKGGQEPKRVVGSESDALLYLLSGRRPETTPKAGVRRTPPFGVVTGARGRPDPQNRCFLGPGKTILHDYIDTKLSFQVASK